MRRVNEIRDRNGLADPTPSKFDMPFLHPRNEEVGYPTQARFSEIGLHSHDSKGSSGDKISGANIGYDLPGVTTTNNGNYEGTVKLIVETNGAVRESIRFVDSLRQYPQFHLLRMVSNSRKDGMEVWIRLHSPNPLRTTLAAFAEVSRVEAAEPSESEPKTAVLRVSLD